MCLKAGEAGLGQGWWRSATELPLQGQASHLCCENSTLALGCREDYMRCQEQSFVPLVLASPVESWCGGRVVTPDCVICCSKPVKAHSPSGLWTRTLCGPTTPHCFQFLQCAGPFPATRPLHMLTYLVFLSP